MFCLFLDAPWFWHVHQDSCGYISRPCDLDLNVQTAVWFHRVYAVYVLPWRDIPSLPTCCEYRPMPRFLPHTIFRAIWNDLISWPIVFKGRWFCSLAHNSGFISYSCFFIKTPVMFSSIPFTLLNNRVSRKPVEIL